MKGQSRFSLRYSVFGFVQKRIKITLHVVFHYVKQLNPWLYLHQRIFFFWCHLNTNLLHFKYAMIPSYLADR